MNNLIDHNLARKLGGLELNSLLYHGVLPHYLFNNTSLEREGTPVYDIDGEVLFYRFSILNADMHIAYVDIAATEAHSHFLLEINRDTDWEYHYLYNHACKLFHEHHYGAHYDEVRFVCYSYPKIAVQFLEKGREVIMLELYTWQPVPGEEIEVAQGEFSQFSRWSLIGYIPEEKRIENREKLTNAINNWNSFYDTYLHDTRFTGDRIDVELFKQHLPSLMIEGGNKSIMPEITETANEEHNSKTVVLDNYTLYGQLTPHWCVCACMEMVLAYFQFHLNQHEIAYELGIDHTRGITLGEGHKLITVIEETTKHTVRVEEHPEADFNTFEQFKDQIDAKFPVISYIPGHSRTVAGYTEVPEKKLPCTDNILIVYDPWPGPKGVISYQNFNSHYYVKSYITAKVQ